MASLFYGAGKDRAEYDYYATPPKAVEELLRLEQFSRRIWEPCCGGGHIAEVLKKRNHSVRATDLADHGYGIAGIDFLACSQTEDEDIITNPPYIQAQAFVEHALQLLTPGHKLAMFMRLSFLETKARKALFLTTPPEESTLQALVLAVPRTASF